MDNENCFIFSWLLSYHLIIFYILTSSARLMPSCIKLEKKVMGAQTASFLIFPSYPWPLPLHQLPPHLTLKYHFNPIGASVRRSSSRAVDCWQWRSCHYFHPYFLFLFFPVFSPPFFFSPSRPFLIEGVLGSKNLFSKSWRERPKT